MKQYIADCKKKAVKLIKLESRGHGDTDNAMREISSQAKVPYQLLWKLKYRPPKSIAFDLVVNLRAYYALKCKEAGEALVDEADAVLREGGLNEMDRAVVVAAGCAGRCAEAGDHRIGVGQVV